MGATNSKKRKYKKEKKKAKKLEKQLENSKKLQNKEVSILLLGTGDSGKSTLVKQLQILYRDGFNNKEIEDYKRVIRNTVRLSMKNLLQSCDELGHDLSNENSSLLTQFEDGLKDKEISNTPKFAKIMSNLWKDDALKKTWQNREKFQIPENSDYFWDSIERIFDESFIPNNIDILNCRIPTVGIKEIFFEVGDKNWRIVDVGGQRSERRKWIHQFEDVDMILFVIGISEYAKNLYEDKNVNRMHESIKVWKDTMKDNHLKKKPTTILFNKVDVFTETLTRISLKFCFPKYEGNDNFEEASKYVVNKFVTKRISKKRDIKHHFTCGTDTEMIQGIVESIMNTIISQSLQGFFI
ncbi:g protein alpha i subunit [Anaeramoeba flamelloides]|uniref:G protein alpha i subunit n=1 Tax=Anaeramoeba flamelloides TaxID=1746091 RepID=A0ABQ8Y5U5_9EUKA|nr:g protein alpha i subunit [Anaeramoeba flamelloides]